MSKDYTIIVTGLPRSGTSMMMSILEAGGIELIVDEIRLPDEDNPKGYYEFEKVKDIKSYEHWINDSKGKAVKIVTKHLDNLPTKNRYKIIYMKRDMSEIITSQNKMLKRSGKNIRNVDDKKLAEIFNKHLKLVDQALKEKDNMEVLQVHYNRIIDYPEDEIKRVAEFLEINKMSSISNMVNKVDSGLYRNRKISDD
jgi:hypothetical protein